MRSHPSHMPYAAMGLKPITQETHGGDLGPAILFPNLPGGAVHHS